jgi:hypothetical protein
LNGCNLTANQRSPGDLSADRSPLADLVHADLPLSGALEPVDLRVSFLRVFLTDTAVDPCPPEQKAFPFQIPAHQIDHLGFRKSELDVDRFKGRAVFPGHFDDAVDINVCHNKANNVTHEKLTLIDRGFMDIYLLIHC